MFAALVALAFLVAPPEQKPAPAPATAIAVRVEAGKAAPASVKPAVDELRAAVEARTQEFRRARAGETPGLVVRVEGTTSREGNSGMSGVLVKGKIERPFTLAFPGDIKNLAAALARNLRDLASEMKAAPAETK